VMVGRATRMQPARIRLSPHGTTRRRNVPASRGPGRCLGFRGVVAG
jgi:hypothetical protein